MNKSTQHSSSFRDPSGFIFTENGIIKRQINPVYFKTYKKLTSSGFFQLLFDNNLLIRHQELSVTDECIILKPEQIPFITYPYEWSFNQYKEAALLTLKLQKLALSKGFSLKDASAFNVVFYKGNAVFIDSLSFDVYKENSPWRAYKQFITHFFGPLILAKYHGASSIKMMSNFIDGIPLTMLSSMLPLSTKLNPFVYANIHLLAKFESKHNEDYKGESVTKSLSKKAQINIIDSLYSHIKKIKLKEKSEWGNYYQKTNYTDKAFNEKSNIINHWIKKFSIKTLIDIGGNDGTFVRKINDDLTEALVCDIDNNAVDFNYKQLKINKESHILPFVLDVLNPSAAIGFNNNERFSFVERMVAYKPDATLALAVIHHMSLSGNVSFEMSAHFFAQFSEHLIVEFPKRTDSWVKRLLKAKGEFESSFDFYSLNNFRLKYLDYFSIIEERSIIDSERVLFLFKRK